MLFSVVVTLLECETAISWFLTHSQ